MYFHQINYFSIQIYTNFPSRWLRCYDQLLSFQPLKLKVARLAQKSLYRKFPPTNSANLIYPQLLTYSRTSHTSSMSSANMSLYDNKFMDYYNYLFSDLAGNTAAKLTRIMCIWNYFLPFRCPHQQLANDSVTCARSYHSRCLFIFCIIMGSQVHVQPKAIPAGTTFDRVQFDSSAR